MARLFDMLLLVIPTDVLIMTVAPRAPGVVFLALPCAAEAALLRWRAQTPAKAAFGLSVTTPQGRALSWPQAMVRSLIAWSGPVVVTLTPEPVGPLVLVALLGLMAGPMLVRGDHRGLHDLVVGSVVTRPVGYRVSRATKAIFIVGGILIGLTIVGLVLLIWVATLFYEG